jgi:AcrR family transcriptional regulator
MKTDNRVRFTKMVIKDSLLDILSNKPIQKVTVKEICEKAQINRATFYLHYQDPYDLLEQIENEMFNDVFSSVMRNIDDIDDLTRQLFEIIEKNIDLCRILFSDNGDKMFLKRIMEFSRDISIEGWKKLNPNVSQQRLEYLYAFVVSGCVAVIEHWVRSGMKETPLELGEIANKASDLWLN